MAMINREEALKLLRSRLHDEKLFKHCISVERIMRSLAKALREDEELWGLVGLLHDIDYEEVGKDLSKHGLISAEILRGLLPDKALRAIRAHNELTGFKDDSRIAKALKAADQVSGLIIATALVMPSRRLDEVRIETLMRKFKQRDFARRVKREKISLIEETGMSLKDFLDLSLKALKDVHEQLGL